MQKLEFPVRLIDAPGPVPAPAQLLIRTEAVGVGIALVRALELSSPSPGGEFVGTVVAVGAEVTGFAAGDRVGGVAFSDAYAELVLADPRLVDHIPAEVDAAAALALVRGGLVAFGALRAGRCAPGDAVLVTGAASGVGHLALQLARESGATRVIAAVSSAGKAAFVSECGADEVVTYDGPWPEPVDLVLDGVGGDLVQRGVDALNPAGRLVAFSAGGGTVDAGSLLAGLKSVQGFAIGAIARSRPDEIAGYRSWLWSLLAAGRLRPRTVAFPWARAAEAVDLVATRRNQGRVVLR